jgi:hypothetical protein
VSIGRSAFNRRTGAVRSSVRRRNIVGSQPTVPRSAPSLPAAAFSHALAAGWQFSAFGAAPGGVLMALRRPMRRRSQHRGRLALPSFTPDAAARWTVAAAAGARRTASSSADTSTGAASAADPGRALSLHSTVQLRRGLQMPLFGLGTWLATNGGECKDAVRAALQLGFRLIDTAQMYDNHEDPRRAPGAAR